MGHKILIKTFMTLLATHKSKEGHLANLKTRSSQFICLPPLLARTFKDHKIIAGTPRR